MSKDYMKYLAVQVINESKIFTYRMLSRELKVHCNAAKRMLYEFHAHENKKRPGSVHATYLIFGTQNAKTYYAIGDSQQDGEDISMTSSPFMSSSVPQAEDIVEAPQKVMTVVREENLDSVKAQFEEILSIHVYSLSPSPLNASRPDASNNNRNIHILSDCNRQILAKHRHEDSLEFGKKYGTIQNPRVKRRTGLRPPPPPAAVAEPPKSKSQKVEPTKADTKPAKAPEKPTTSSNVPPKPEPKPISQPKPAERKPIEKKPGVKKEPSDIFKSFGKTKAPTAKPTREETDTSNASAAASVKEDEPMKDASESEQEEDFMPSATTLPSKNPKSTGPTKSEREATLRKMMDEDSDEEMSDVGASKDQTPEPAPPPVKEPTPEPPVVTSGGRRRGRRKVMRKKTVKDEEGYIITREEPAWESFSEDEPPPPPSKKPHLPTPTTSTSTTKAGAKKGGAGAKAGQGNIMNFFGKK